MTIAVCPLVLQPESVLPIELHPADPAPIPFRIGEPPTANRGLIPQRPIDELSPAIDNCCFSLKAVPWETIQEIRSEISTLGKTSFVDKPDQGRKHGIYFPSHMAAPMGASILYRKRQGFADLWDMLAVVPGKLCQRMGTSSIAGLLRLVYIYEGSVSRIDINVDDYKRDLTDEAIAEAASQGHYTRFQHWEPRGKVNCKGEKQGFTHYFGSRGSETLVRIYDALPVHGIDATRFEVEYKGATANAIAKAIAECETDESLSETLRGILNGTFRITTAKRNHNTNRIPNAPFWQRFSDRLGIASRIAVPQRRPTLESKLRWLREQCSKSLAMFRQYYGINWKGELESLIKEGMSRFTASDFALLEASIKDGFVRFWDGDSHVIDLEGDPDWLRAWMSDEDLRLEDAPF